MKKLCLYCLFITLLSPITTFAEPDKEESLNNAMDYLVWNPWGGTNDGKAVYVFGGVNCPWTQKAINFIDQNEKKFKDVQMRFVFPPSSYSAPGDIILSTDPLPQAFMDLQNRKGREANNVEKHQRLISKNVEYWIYELFNDFGYPMFIYKTPNGITITHDPQQVEKDIPNILPWPKSNKGQELAENIVRAKKGKKVKVENKSKKEFMHSFVAPDKESLSLDKLNYGIPPGYISNDMGYDYSPDFYLLDNDEYIVFINKTR